MECPFFFIHGGISLLLEVVSKSQIAFESPAWQRDFTSIFMKIREFNKRRPMKKRSPAAARDDPSKEVCNAAIGRKMVF